MLASKNRDIVDVGIFWKIKRMYSTKLLLNRFNLSLLLKD